MTINLPLQLFSYDKIWSKKDDLTYKSGFSLSEKNSYNEITNIYRNALRN